MQGTGCRWAGARSSEGQQALGVEDSSTQGSWEMQVVGYSLGKHEDSPKRSRQRQDMKGFEVFRNSIWLHVPSRSESLMLTAIHKAPTVSPGRGAVRPGEAQPLALWHLVDKTGRQ